MLCLTLALKLNNKKRQYGAIKTYIANLYPKDYTKINKEISYDRDIYFNIVKENFYVYLVSIWYAYILEFFSFQIL